MGFPGPVAVTIEVKRPALFISTEQNRAYVVTAVSKIIYKICNKISFCLSKAFEA
jgi:hypothetical protein